MATNKTHPLGSCPQCNAEISPVHVIIEYETESNKLNMFAECPACQEAVTTTSST